MAEAQASQFVSDKRTHTCYRVAIALVGLCLFGATWILWTPQTVYPQIPWFAWGCDVPGWVDYICFGLTLASLVVLLIPPIPKTVERTAWIVLGASLLASCLLDQHRFQPWAYQLMIVSVLMAVCRDALLIKLLRAIVLSIYVYSAISKLDYSFCQDLGQVFLSTLAQQMRLADDPAVSRLAASLALVFPLFELLVACLIMSQFTRRFGVACAVIMHSLLILIVSSWGLNHEAGVMLWNILFIAQAIILFWPKIPKPQSADANRTALDPSPEDNPIPKRLSLAEQLTLVFAILVMVAPLGESWGKFDHWPGWALYASHVSGAQVLLSPWSEDRLPEELFFYTEEISDEFGMKSLNIRAWSLDQTHVPGYPQDRFEIAVAKAVAQKYGLKTHMQVVVSEQASRFSGYREERHLIGLSKIQEESKRYFFNTNCRRIYLED
ncbi:MAG: hypothetical protein COA78_32235 [Blastopirellula sp.]|nr:MAG: hypothetical protein COA78_32235 [Blastopirellula sp.]